MKKVGYFIKSDVLTFIRQKCIYIFYTRNNRKKFVKIDLR